LEPTARNVTTNRRAIALKIILPSVGQKPFPASRDFASVSSRPAEQESPLSTCRPPLGRTRHHPEVHNYDRHDKHPQPRRPHLYKSKLRNVEHIRQAIFVAGRLPRFRRPKPVLLDNRGHYRYLNHRSVVLS